MVEEISEPIDVVAAFSEGKIWPILFSWRHCRYYNLKVTATWNDRDGDARRVHFSVMSDSANLYEICFHTRFFKWSLAKIYYEG
jgi:hypothetical protein